MYFAFGSKPAHSFLTENELTEAGNIAKQLYAFTYEFTQIWKKLVFYLPVGPQASRICLDYNETVEFGEISGVSKTSFGLFNLSSYSREKAALLKSTGQMGNSLAVTAVHKPSAPLKLRLLL